MNLVWIALMLLSGIPALAATDDCSRMTTPQASFACELLKHRGEMAANYNRLRKQLSPKAAEEVENDQREWLASLRVTCPKNKPAQVSECLDNAYLGRLVVLGTVHKIEGITFFSRQKHLVGPPSQNPEPGAGIGQFEWPEIDSPTAAQAAWNRAIRARVVEMANEDDDRPSRNFNPNLTDFSIFSAYFLTAVNQRFVGVLLTEEADGGAHPSEQSFSFQWWLDRGRALRADDVFRPGSGWETFIAEHCVQLFRADRADDLYDDSEARQGAMRAVQDVQTWRIDSSGFHIDFPQYSVAPRVSGSFSASLKWAELQPYLASAFDPSTLPKPIPDLALCDSGTSYTCSPASTE